MRTLFPASVLLSLAGCLTPAPDLPPSADAGSDQIVPVSTQAVLDGSASTDPDGEVVAWAWILQSAPMGSTATLSISDGPTAGFTPDLEGVYVFRLQVSDDDGLVSAPDIVTLSTPVASGNLPPVADLVLVGTPAVGAAVTLDGTASADPEGASLSWDLRVVEAPAGSGATPASTGTGTWTFTPDLAGFYAIGLAVSDGEATSSRDDVTFHLPPDGNQAPVADAGDDTEIWLGQTAGLNADASFDPDGDPLTFSWTLEGTPPGSVLTTSDILGADTPYAALTPDVAGVYSLNVTVSDGALSASDPVLVNALASDNTPPVADAGPDLDVRLGDPAFLDGSRSFDPDGDALAWTWLFQVLPPGSLLTDGDLSGADTPFPTFTPDLVGTFQVMLSVDDGLSSAEDTVDVQVTGIDTHPPVADAGPDLAVAVGEPASLDGSASYDPDGDVLTWTWTFSALPGGSLLLDGDLVGADTPNPTFTPDVEGPYEVQLQVSDGVFVASDLAVVTATGDANDPPVAVAGDDQDGTLGDLVRLDGSSSYDPDGDAISFAWSLASVPPGSLLAPDDLTDATTATPTFTPDVEGDYLVDLQVSDGAAAATDQVRIRILAPANQAPVAEAGRNRSVTLGDTTRLDGSSSYDPDGDSISFSWTFAGLPAGSALADGDLVDAGTATPSFLPDVAGTFTLEVRVSDGSLTDTDTARVTVTDPMDLPPVADAGLDVDVPLGDAAWLDGSGSYDPEGDAITWTWAITSVPTGSSVTDADLTGAATADASFVPDVLGTFVLTLTVSDGRNTDTDTVRVNVAEAGNEPPQADAGPDLGVDVGLDAVLDGSASFDPDGAPVTFSWTFDSLPVGSSLEDGDLAGGDTAVASFVPDVAGEYVVLLVVSDGTFTASDTARVTASSATDRPPVADAGTDQAVNLGERVSLDGGASSDPEGESLTFTWSFDTQPPGSRLDDDAIASSATSTPWFTPDVDGTWLLVLTVSDGTFTATDTVLISVSAPPDLPPVADAGPDDTLALGDLAVLDGSASYDPEGLDLTWSWTFAATPAGSALTDADLVDGDTAAPTFTPDVEGDWDLLLTVSDGVQVSTDTVRVTVTAPADQAPVASAGPDQTLSPGTSVALDGSGSYDPEGATLTYTWTFYTLPTGSTLTSSSITGASAAIAGFDPDVAGTYILRLVVSDGALTGRDYVYIYVIDPSNTAPVASAGPDQAVDLGDTVYLDGTASYDPEGMPVTWTWSFRTLATGSALTSASLSGATTATPSFVPDVPGTYQLRLKVWDGAFSTNDYMVVTVTGSLGTPPVADAGADQATCGLGPVTLDGSASSDPDGDALTWSWSFADLPEGSALTDADLAGSDTPTPSFTPDVPGTWNLTLVVSDGTSTASDTVQVVEGGQVLAAWHLDEGGGSTVTDASGAGHDGTLTGGGWTGGRHFGALSLQGDGCVAVADHPDLDLTSTFTLEWWMRADDGERDYEVVMMKGNPYAWSVWRYGTALRFRATLASGGTFTHQASTWGLGDGAWHHYAMVFDGSTFSTWEDGALLAEDVLAEAPATAAGPLALGCPTDGTATYPLDADLDEVVLRAEALPEDSIVALAGASTAWCSADQDRTAPTATITAPAPGDLLDSRYVLVEGTAADASGIVSIEVNGEPAGATSANYATWAATVPLDDGVQTLTVRTEDAAGNVDPAAATLTVEVTEACTADVVLLWPLDEDDGTAPQDRSPFGLDASVTGAPDSLVGAWGNGIRFDGATTLWVEDDPLLDLETAFTVDFALRHSGAAVTDEVILSKGDGGEASFGLGVSGDFVVFTLLGVDGTYTALLAPGLLDGTWHHVAATWDGATAALYADGILVSSQASPAVPATNDGPLTVGSYAGTDAFYTGDLDQVRIRDGAVAASDIPDLATEACALSANLAAPGAATASTTLTSTYGARKVIDGYTDEESIGAATMWLTAEGTTGYVEIDLGATRTLAQIRWCNTHGGTAFDRATTAWSIQASSERRFKGEQVEIARGTGTLETTLAFHAEEVRPAVRARYVRFYVEGFDGPGGGVNEIQVLGF